MLRITHACAGKSIVTLLIECVKLDHPRVCGEKLPMYFGIDDKLGSPPRVRGKG